MKRIGPATVASLVASAYVAWRLVLFGWDPVGLFELGDRLGSEGYDGQFSYFIAINPDPAQVAEQLDVPSYRYQRILLPGLSRVLGLGLESWIPWTLILTNLAAHHLATWSVAGLLQERGVSKWYSLSYGLWVGMVAPVGTGLNEPLAYGLVALGMLLLGRGRLAAGPILLGLATLAKETTIVFLGAVTMAELTGKRRLPVLAAVGAGGLAFILWQLWLRATFGAFGLASGGAMATGFELIPFLGLFRIGEVSQRVLALYLVIFGPSIVLPALWGVLVSLRDLFKRVWQVETWVLFANGLSVMVLPFSTFREPLGLVRFADGLVLAVLVYAASRRSKRALRYSLLWSALLVMLVSR